MKWLLIFLFSANLFAQKINMGNYTVYRLNNKSTFRIQHTPNFDNWSVGHMAGGAVFSRTLRILGVKNRAVRFWATLGAGVVYEIYKDGFGNPVPLTGGRDERGADLIGDTFFTALGGLIDAMISWFTSKSVQMKYENKSVILEYSW